MQTRTSFTDWRLAETRALLVQLGFFHALARGHAHSTVRAALAWQFGLSRAAASACGTRCGPSRGVALVNSPLIALMHDQVGVLGRALLRHDLRAVHRDLARAVGDLEPVEVVHRLLGVLDADLVALGLAGEHPMLISLWPKRALAPTWRHWMGNGAATRATERRQPGTIWRGYDDDGSRRSYAKD
jgi:hypothetical protein